ncbi:MAG: hypothetical protein KC731_18840 [Myxococcales bacterium]|nr:hypothetical protein [Myxococcales bacterium]
MRLTLAPLVALLLALPGCFGGGKSQIEANERVETGRREFDSYFADVDAIRDEVEKLDADMYEVRERLVDELAVNPDISLGALLEKTKKRVEKAKGYGTSLTLALSPSPHIIAVAGESSDDRDDQLGTAIEQSAQRAFDTFKSRSVLLEQVADLDRKRGELADRIDNLPKRFEDKKSLMEEEIVGAGRVLRSVEKRLLKDTRTLSHFLVGLSVAVDSGAMEGRDAKCDEAIAYMEEHKKKKPAPRPRWRGGGGKPRPRPQPSGGGFEM